MSTCWSKHSFLKIWHTGARRAKLYSQTHHQSFINVQLQKNLLREKGVLFMLKQVLCSATKTNVHVTVTVQCQPESNAGHSKHAGKVHACNSLTWSERSAQHRSLEVNSTGTICADSYFSIRSTPVLPQWHVKDPSHSAWSAGGRLQLNTHTLYVCDFAWSDMVHVWMWLQPCQHCKYTTLGDI